jgi:multidrug resistance protein
MFAPGVPSLMKEFNSTSSTLASFVVSVYVLGFGVGPLFLAPFSELYGRVPVYHVTNVLFVIFNVACALATDLNMLIGFRFLAGVAGSACLTIGGGTIADLIAQERRGIAMSGFVLGPLLGPVIGPVAGGFASQSIGWRWIFYILAIATGCFSILCVFLLKESYAPILLARKTARLIKETGNTDLRSKLDTGLAPGEVFTRAIVRPIKLLVLSPIVLMLSLYMGVVYGYLYLLFTTFAVVFQEQYHFSSGAVGLSFLGIGLGSLLGLVFTGFTSDKILKALARKNSPPGTADADLVFKPEYRLPPILPFSVLIPVGLLIYGWTAKFQVHYIVPIFGTLLIGIGNLGVFMSIQMYMVDAFTIFAASALAANTVIRSVLGAVLPLAGQDMYKTLGLGWGNSLLAFIALGLSWVPWVIVVWGERIRIKYPVKL